MRDALKRVEGRLPGERSQFQGQQAQFLEVQPGGSHRGRWALFPNAPRFRHSRQSHFVELADRARENEFDGRV